MRADARRAFRESGICVLEGFLLAEAVSIVLEDLSACVDHAYVCTTHSTVYLRPGDKSLPFGHPGRVEETTRVGTLAQDQLPRDSPLRRLHESTVFRRFVGDIVGSKTLYGYADGLTSVNVLVYEEGHHLGWHFDESDYALTIMLRPASDGGAFEYALPFGGSRSVKTLRAGSLMLFRGGALLHRVTPVRSGGPRIVAILSYGTRRGIQLSKDDRKLFYGRIT
jgi:hypothetical protein